MSKTKTLPTPALSLRSQSLFTSLFRRRPEQGSSCGWPDPQLSIGAFIVTIGRNSIWEAIGPARDAFAILGPEIQAYLNLSTEPIPCYVTWSIYMLGRAASTASPTVIFCGSILKHREDIRKSVKHSGILSRYPGFKTGHLPKPPDFDRLVPLAHGNLPANIESLTVYAMLSEQVCGTRIFINGSTPSGIEYSRKATVGGVIKVHDRFFYTTAGHPFAAGIDEDSDAFSFDGSEAGDLDSPEITVTTSAKLEDQNPTLHTSSRSPYSDCTPHHLQPVSSSDHLDAQPLLQTTSMETVSALAQDSGQPSRQAYSPSETAPLNKYNTAPPNPDLHLSGAFSMKMKSKIRAPPAAILGSGVPTAATLQVELVNAENSSTDYALIAVEETVHMVPNEISSNEYPSHKVTYDRLASFGSSEWLILAITSRGTIPGTLCRTPSYVLTPGSKSFCETRFAKFSAPLEEGDSGSWVVHQSFGDVYGHIVAGSPHQGMAIVIPFSIIFADIETLMGSLPQFPKDLRKGKARDQSLTGNEDPFTSKKPDLTRILKQIGHGDTKQSGVAEPPGDGSNVSRSRQSYSGAILSPIPTRSVQYHDAKGILISKTSAPLQLLGEDGESSVASAALSKHIWKHHGASVIRSAPPKHNRKSVDPDMNIQPASPSRYELPCEVPGCAKAFHGDEEVEWIGHTEGHLGGTFPNKLRCCKTTLEWSQERC